MALNFGSASAQYLEGPAVLTAAPCTLACWYKTTDLTNTCTLVALDYTASLSTLRLIVAAGAIQAYAFDGVTGSIPSAGSLTSGVWAHCAAVFASPTSRSAYRDGANKTSDTASVTPANINALDIGVVYTGGGTQVQFANGTLAEVGIWNVALADSDIAMLGAGFAPLAVRPDALVRYYPLVSSDGAACDRMGGSTLTAFHGPVPQPHPRILYRSGKTARWLSKISQRVTNTTSQLLTASLDLYRATQYTQNVTATAQSLTATLALATTVFDTTQTIVQMGGADHTSDVLLTSLRVENHVGEQPDLCFFTTKANPSVVPTVNTSVLVALGNTHAENSLFGGRITTVEQVYQGVQTNVAYQVTCQDFSFDLNRRHPFKAYVATNAATVIADLITTFAPGTASAIDGGLPTISVAFDGNGTFATCLTRVCTLTGTHWLVDPSNVLRVFTSSIGGTAPATIDAANIAPSNPNGARALTIVKDLSQIRNKVWMEGGGTVGAISGSATVVSPGAGAGGGVLPLSQSVGFAPSGYCVINLPIAGSYPLVTQKHFCSYSSVNQGGLVPAPTGSPVFANVQAGGALEAGQSYYYAYSYGTAAGETGIGPLAGIGIPTFNGQSQVTARFFLTPPSDSSVTRITLYRSIQIFRGGNSGSLFVVGTLTKPAWPATWSNPVVFFDGVNDAQLGGTPPAASGAPCPQGIIPGPPGALTQYPGLNGLVSLTSTLPAIPVGTQVNVAGLFDGSAGSPYGVREHWLSDNEAVSPATCLARATAEYALFGQPLVDATYQTRDTNTRAGKLATWALGAPTNFAQSLLIQSVTVTQFGIPHVAPLFDVKASSSRWTLADLLRRVGGLVTINGVVVGTA